MFYCWRWYQRHVAEQHGTWVVSGCFYWCVHRWRGHRLAWIEKEQHLVLGSVTACDLHQQRSVSRIVMLISSYPEILDFCLQNLLQVQQERASLCTSGPRCRHADHHCNRPWEVRLLRSDNRRPFKVMGWMLEDWKNWLQMRLDMLMMLMKYLARCTRKEILWQDLGEEEEDEQWGIVMYCHALSPCVFGRDFQPLFLSCGSGHKKSSMRSTRLIFWFEVWQCRVFGHWTALWFATDTSQNIQA